LLWHRKYRHTIPLYSQPRARTIVCLVSKPTLQPRIRENASTFASASPIRTSQPWTYQAAQIFQSSSVYCPPNEQHNHRHRDAPHQTKPTTEKPLTYLLARFLPQFSHFVLRPPFVSLINAQQKAQPQNEQRGCTRLFSRARHSFDHYSHPPLGFSRLCDINSLRASSIRSPFLQ
jgi:hypothetical protein